MFPPLIRSRVRVGFCVMANNPLPASPLSGGGATHQELYTLPEKKEQQKH
jgi:hypothetical protein